MPFKTDGSKQLERFVEDANSSKRVSGNVESFLSCPFQYVTHASTTSGQNEVLRRPTCLALWFCRCRRRSSGRSPKGQTNPRGCHMWWCHLRWCPQWWCHAKWRWASRIIKQAGHITTTARHGSFSIPGWLSHSLKAIPQQLSPLNIWISLHVASDQAYRSPETKYPPSLWLVLDSNSRLGTSWCCPKACAKSCKCLPPCLQSRWSNCSRQPWRMKKGSKGMHAGLTNTIDILWESNAEGPFAVGFVAAVWALQWIEQAHQAALATRDLGPSGDSWRWCSTNAWKVPCTQQCTLVLVWDSAGAGPRRKPNHVVLFAKVLSLWLRLEKKKKAVFLIHMWYVHVCIDGVN